MSILEQIRKERLKIATLDLPPLAGIKLTPGEFDELEQDLGLNSTNSLGRRGKREIMVDGLKITEGPDE